MDRCPKCGSPRIYRSRSRGLVERLRKTISSKRPYRCHVCGWRGWGVESEDAAQAATATRARAGRGFETIDTIVVEKVAKDRSPRARK